MLDQLALQHVRLRLLALRHEDRVVREEAAADLADGAELRLQGARLRVGVAQSITGAGGVRLDCTFTVVEGAVDQAAVAVAAEFARWSTDDWVFMPSCVYAGNRFPQAPPVDQRFGLGKVETRPDPHTWVTITQCPHLTHGAGPSRIQVLVGDCSTPLVGVQSPASGRGLILVTDQGTAHGDSGLDVIETDDRSRARVLVKSPGVREGGKYNFKGPLPDTGARLAKGDSIVLRVVVHAFAARSPEDLYSRFMVCRKELTTMRERHDLPFASAWKLLEAKHNRDNWVEAHGYYSVGMRESLWQDWQTSWVGGANTFWPLLIRGDGISFERAQRGWSFIAEQCLLPGGGLKGCFLSSTKKWYSSDDTCYMRFVGDSLYFMMKSLLHLRVGSPHVDPKPSWLHMARTISNAMVKLWDESGHIPHWMDGTTGKVHLGGSCAGALVPGGLMLAARYFNEPRYREVAEAAARRYRDHYLAKGLTNGGPGDIYQNVDSESAASLLESFITLMEETNGAQEWIDASRRCAAYCATWVTTYDFRFPTTSTFGRMDMLTTGTVWANVQNKHAAPGLCTLSGASLIKLWRVTGEACWLDLVRDIARCLPQFISRADRPVVDRRPGQRWNVLPSGWVNERCNLSDWEVTNNPREDLGVGDVFGGSCWSEAAVMNTIAEVPGIILATDTMELSVIDHVHVQIAHASPDRLVLRVTNSTPFDAEPVLLAEDAAERRARWMGINPLAGLPTIRVPALTTVEYTVWRDTPIRMGRA
jgi:hypothetical protein